jgi:glycosyltransferase involved in cell wall biosynthesis
MNEPPEEVRRLAEERAERRRTRDFSTADALRERIRALGFEVTDRPDGGFDLTQEEITRPGPSLVRAEEIPSVLGGLPTADVTVQWLSEGWPNDVLRGIVSFRRYEERRSVQHVVVETTRELTATWPEGVEVIRLAEDPGFGAARNAGLRRSLGRVVIVADCSVEADADPYGPLEQTLADPSVGIAGPYGLVTDDLREFREADGPEVDAVEGYVMALRREVLAEGLAFDERYRFYRAADIDLCFQAKARRLRVVRVVVPVRRHEHRRWAATSHADRERLSKRNFYRFLDKFRGRTDLLVAGN